MKNKLSVVLVNPQIPQNTGTIARLIACTDLDLFLVGQLGFKLDASRLKRAGLDYWDKLSIKHLNHIDELYQQYPQNTFYYYSTKGTQNYSAVVYKPGDFLVFGSETAGLPQEILFKNQERVLRIPMVNNVRSLNLANTVSIIVYEALKQNSFFNLQ